MIFLLKVLSPKGKYLFLSLFMWRISTLLFFILFHLEDMFIFIYFFIYIFDDTRILTVYNCIYEKRIQNWLFVFWFNFIFCNKYNIGYILVSICLAIQIDKMVMTVVRFNDMNIFSRFFFFFCIFILIIY